MGGVVCAVGFSWVSVLSGEAAMVVLQTKGFLQLCKAHSDCSSPVSALLLTNDFAVERQ